LGGGGLVVKDAQKFSLIGQMILILGQSECQGGTNGSRKNVSCLYFILLGVVKSLFEPVHVCLIVCLLVFSGPWHIMYILVPSVSGGYHPK
jgi:hypothetical protein